MYRAQVESVINWCDANNLILNVTKTKEMIIDFPHNKNNKRSLIIKGQTVEVVNTFKFLGSYIYSDVNDLQWYQNSIQSISKAPQCLYY
ncbi:hypothetical protein HOLleu_05751 [Holothuria leucospilota]|uniref:Uncharacterized protein n=1 Tax=Holothuria leucospilota TaxID=206669 RepID=A0A9Q1CLG3_HOLLE|nr:hypothetical protein HOLleu_05751 [Holothuria leucospilota]